MSIISESRLGVEYLDLESSFGPVKGFINKDYPNVAQFLGIRFAEAPVGPRRWLPPVAKARSDGLIDATEFGPSCPQFIDGPPSVYNSDVPEFGIKDPMGEDCLSLCIWAPAQAAQNPETAKLPVIVWITGGAFLVGGSTVPYQNPTSWVETSQRHLVVTINYRVSIFGFSNAAGLDPKERNLGLLDQRAGLEWVYQHIASFGGDPSRLTHFGQSAGGRSIDVHSFQYPEKPLVRNLIMTSGTALPPIPAPEPGHTHFSFVARALGFPGGDSQTELEYMREQPFEKLSEAIKTQFYTGEKPFLSFRPIVDGVTDRDNYEELTREGKFSKLPAIIGVMNDEGNSVAPYNPDGVDPEIAQRITKDFFHKSSNTMAQARSAHAPTFQFLYKDFAPEGKSTFPNIAPRPWLRAYHSTDIPLVFGTHSWFRSPSTPLEEKISRAWQELYVLFAEDGPEALRRLGWKDVSEGGAIIIGRGESGWEPVPLSEIIS
ncbi:alpha/beta-hydrolase [Thozetella sp. PMI_491]|nr:alpha/beta-hydrolase [Thozetella sp. PMI_491]